MKPPTRLLCACSTRVLWVNSGVAGADADIVEHDVGCAGRARSIVLDLHICRVRHECTHIVLCDNLHPVFPDFDNARRGCRPAHVKDEVDPAIVWDWLRVGPTTANSAAGFARCVNVDVDEQVWVPDVVVARVDACCDRFAVRDGDELKPAVPIPYMCCPVAAIATRKIDRKAVV